MGIRVQADIVEMTLVGSRFSFKRLDTRLISGHFCSIGLSIDSSWSFVSSLLWIIVSLIDTCLYHRRKLNPYNNTMQCQENESRFHYLWVQVMSRIVCSSKKSEQHKKDEQKFCLSCIGALTAGRNKHPLLKLNFYDFFFVLLILVPSSEETSF